MRFMRNSPRGALVIALAALGALAVSASAAAVGEPDLTARLPERTPAYVKTLGSTVRYHFDAVLWNARNAGAFELIGSGCNLSECPTVTQRIWTDGTPGGGFTDRVIPNGQ